MAEPTQFAGQNRVFSKPESMTDEECAPLPVMDTGDTLVSCWKLTPEEIEEVQRTGVVFLGILGRVQQPVWISGHDPLQSFTSEN